MTVGILGLPSAVTDHGYRAACSPRHMRDIVLGVVRGAALHRLDASAVDALEPGDRILYVNSAGPNGQSPVVRHARRRP